MKALLVNPSQTETFFNYKHALGFIRKKAAMPPLGLLTVAALLPDTWPRKVVDLAVEPLTEAHLEWADAVFISAMIIQQDSVREVVARCKGKGLTVVAGGPLFKHLYPEFPGVDHFILGEAEEILPEFLRDLEAGRAAPIYQARRRPDLSLTPVPAWDLIRFHHYHSLSVQFSRGCPFDCEFCDIVQLFGRRPRFKTPAQISAELDRLHDLGWRGDIMFVDDNFIGHKNRARELLLELGSWQRERGYPFTFNTQASVNLAREPELMRLMNRANLTSVFLGIETPAPDSLRECGKRQNQEVDLVEAVKTIQANGLTVSGGFIIGFDSDPESIFDDQVRFIEQAAIPTAMVGLLSVGPGTRLFDRLRSEGRLLGRPTGNNTADCGALNFIPRMNREKLIAGYCSVLLRLYEPRAYYKRVFSFLKNQGPSLARKRLPGLPGLWKKLPAAVRVFWRLGLAERGRRAFWGFLLKVGLTRPGRLKAAVEFAALGYHFKKITAAFAAAGRTARPV